MASPGSRPLSLERFQERGFTSDDDLVVVEEPLEIRYHHRPVATLMRTPGDDAELALGYLYGEGWVDSVDDVGAVALCSRPAEGGAGEQNIVDLIPALGKAPSHPAEPRSNTASSSCGVCGKRTIEEAMRLLSPPARSGGQDAGAALAGGDGVSFEPAAILSFPSLLRSRQKLFASTGALHAAGLFDAAGRLLVVREDIGRHNAVDKVIGHVLRGASLPLEGCALQVSGRVSFEIVQKAYRAGVPAVCAVSGVSSLAVDFAKAAGITLVGFLRAGGFSVYSAPERLFR